eukprot:Rhum_TRINITY_DN528_c0_g1::Rhum_TRINITY_DN528_c0_g1_i1::g.1650::m.1650
MLRLAALDDDVGDLDVRGLHVVELLLRGLGGLAQTLDGDDVALQVDALLLLEGLEEARQQRLVDVLTSQEGVAVRRLHLEHAALDLEDRDIERAATQVEDGHPVLALLVHAVRKRSRRGLVDDTGNLHAGDVASVLRGHPLLVVEVGGHGHDSPLDRLARGELAGLPHLCQHVRRDRRRRVLLAVRVRDPRVAVVRRHDRVRHGLLRPVDRLVGETPADETLHGVEGVLRVRHRLPARRAADQERAVLRDSDHTRRRPRTLGVLAHLRLVTVHEGHARVGGTQVNTHNDLADTPPARGRRELLSDTLHRYCLLRELRYQ